MSVNASCNLLRMRTCADTLLLLVDIFSGLAAGASSSSYRSVMCLVSLDFISVADRVESQMLFLYFEIMQNFDNIKSRKISF